MGRVAGKVVVVTGASSGIGRATVLRLARKGALVVAAARREEPLESLKRECAALGAECLVVPTDVSVVTDVEALADKTLEAYGRIDAWVNNAGVYVLGALEDTPLDVYRRVMDVDYFGVVHGTRAALQRMRELGRGIIINVSSQVASMGAAYASAYAAAKHAVRGFTSSVRQELLGSGIEVCNVMPVGIDTPLFEHAANFTGYEIKAPEPVYPPESVAKKIVALLLEPRAETYVGSNGPVFAGLRHLSPAAFDKLMRKQMDHGHFKNRREPPQQGNLYQPIASGTGLHGEFHGRSKLWLRRVAVWSLLGIGALRLRQRLLEA